MTGGTGAGTARSPRNVPALLLGLREEGFSGSVVVSGSPGGTIHLRSGLVSAIETPSAPTAESVMLKSGRVGDQDLAAARAAGREGDGLGPELVARGLLGAAELEVICTAAVFDGAFAMTLTPPGSWEVTGPTPALVTQPGIEPQRLAEETGRRQALLSRRWGSPSELARARIRPAVLAGPAHGRLSPRYQAILTAANGRRTPRDIAFALGRGVFSVMVDLVRMDDLRLLQWEQRRPAGRPSTAPRVAPAPPSAGGPPKAALLPRRSPGNHFPTAGQVLRTGVPGGEGGT